MEKTMTYLLYPVVIALAMLAAILSASTATL